MKQGTRFVGLDVHKETIAVAVAESRGEVRSLGVIPNNADAVRKLVAKIGQKARFCYEAGPCGYVLYWQLSRLGVQCVVVAPTLVPVKAGDRVKTDRRDAEKLARCFRAGDLTSVWVPDAAHEALRELVRTREAAKEDQRRARTRVKMFLLRHGIVVSKGTGPGGWSEKYKASLHALRFEIQSMQEAWTDLLAELRHLDERQRRLDVALDTAIAAAPEKLRKVIEALQTLRGVAQLAAATIAVEAGVLSRFSHPSQLMGYSGLVPGEHSSGSTTRRGAITKTGNGRLRRILIEAAWAYRYQPRVGVQLKRRQVGQPQAVIDIGWKAQHRLHSRYYRLSAKGKPHNVVVTAVARELLGFVWAVGTHVESASTAG